MKRGRKQVKRQKVYYKKLNKDSVRSQDNMPRINSHGLRPGADHSRIPSHGIEGVEVRACAKTSVLEQVHRGQIKGAEAKEIVRKSKCLAPAYNKGAYQYVGSEQSAKDAGHKGAGEGER